MVSASNNYSIVEIVDIIDDAFITKHSIELCIGNVDGVIEYSPTTNPSCSVELKDIVIFNILIFSNQM